MENAGFPTNTPVATTCPPRHSGQAAAEGATAMRWRERPLTTHATNQVKVAYLLGLIEDQP